MKRVHVVGVKNSGKTTLIEELVRELVRRGYRVGTIKHSSHRHDVDVPGKDSHRHGLAGGCPAALVTADSVGVFFPAPPGQEVYEELAPWYAACDLVIVEGGLDARAPKVEVWRRGLAGVPLAAGRSDIAAVVTDEAVEIAVECWPRSSVSHVADGVLTLAGTREDE